MFDSAGDGDIRVNDATLPLKAHAAQDGGSYYLQYHGRRARCTGREGIQTPPQPAERVHMESAGSPAGTRLTKARAIPASAPSSTDSTPYQDRSPAQGVTGMGGTHLMQGLLSPFSPWAWGPKPGHPLGRRHPNIHLQALATATTEWAVSRLACFSLTVLYYVMLCYGIV